MPFQAVQLAALAVVHLIIDFFPGILPAVLPVVRARFGLSLTAGVALITVLNLTCNCVQMLTGGMRKSRDTLFFLPLGLWLGGAVCLCGLVVPNSNGIAWLFALVVLTGIGVAVVHPEALRAVHALGDISPSLTTSIFIVGGFFGYSGGAWLSSFIVTHWGLRGLTSLLVLPLIGTVLVFGLRIKVATESGGPAMPRQGPAAASADNAGLRFWPLLGVTTPAAIGTITVPSLVPTHLYELGFPLTFGGLSSLVFGLGVATGSVFWGSVVRREHYLKCAALTLVVGVPFLYGYVLFSQYRLAVGLLGLAAFWLGAAYPLMITLARYASGPSLGQRMAIIVGGTGAVASIVLLAFGPVAERLGVPFVLKLACVWYLAAAACGGILIKRHNCPGGSASA